MVPIIIIIFLAYIGTTMYLANQQASDNITVNHRDANNVRLLLLAAGWFTGLLGLFLVFAAVTADQLQSQDGDVIPIPTEWVLLGIVISGTITPLIFAFIQSDDLRYWLRDKIGDQGRYDPESLVHLTAVVLTLMLVTTLLILFIADGGPEGAVETASEISVNGTLLQNVLMIAAAGLGVGFAIRRDEKSTLKRLGLRLPTEEDLRWGIGIGFASVIGLIVFGLIVVLILGDANNEAAQAQAEALKEPSLIVMVFLLAVIAIGEEIFFRGAIQPIFGNIATSIFFVTLHTQSLFSPLIVGLLVVSLLFGWLRTQHSTTAAIIAHFCYNLIQLLFP